MSDDIKRNKCRYCINYEGYYVKKLHYFESIKQGYCSKNNKIVGSSDCCECWKAGSRKAYIRKRAASRALYEILMDISAIRQILQENQDEEDNM